MVTQDRYTVLEASRRIDWRFLLPTPALGRVAYAGRDEDLRAALELFAESLTVLAAGDGNEDAACDLVVLAGASWRLADAGVTRLRAGGRLYVELPPPRARGTGGGARSPRGYASTLEALGLDEVELHWHWPSFSGCAEIVPLADDGVVRLALARRRASTAARAKALASGVALRARLFERLVPAVSVIARKPPVVGNGS